MPTKSAKEDDKYDSNKLKRKQEKMEETKAKKPKFAAPIASVKFSDDDSDFELGERLKDICEKLKDDMSADPHVGDEKPKKDPRSKVMRFDPDKETVETEETEEPAEEPAESENSKVEEEPKKKQKKEKKLQSELAKKKVVEEKSEQDASTSAATCDDDKSADSKKEKKDDESNAKKEESSKKARKKLKLDSPASEPNKKTPANKKDDGDQPSKADSKVSAKSGDPDKKPKPKQKFVAPSMSANPKRPAKDAEPKKDDVTQSGKETDKMSEETGKESTKLPSELAARSPLRSVKDLEQQLMEDELEEGKSPLLSQSSKDQFVPSMEDKYKDQPSDDELLLDVGPYDTGNEKKSQQSHEADVRKMSLEDSDSDCLDLDVEEDDLAIPSLKQVMEVEVKGCSDGDSIHSDPVEMAED
jgi:hypothetical protein